MKKKLFTKDWLNLHPYKTADGVDQYYPQLANKIYLEQEETYFNELFDDDEDAKHLTLCISAYFEDVISGMGIWRRSRQTKAYASHKRTYNSWQTTILEEDETRICHQQSYGKRI